MPSSAFNPTSISSLVLLLLCKLGKSTATNVHILGQAERVKQPLWCADNDAPDNIVSPVWSAARFIANPGSTRLGIAVGRWACERCMADLGQLCCHIERCLTDKDMEVV